MTMKVRWEMVVFYLMLVFSTVLFVLTGVWVLLLSIVCWGGMVLLWRRA